MKPFVAFRSLITAALLTSAAQIVSGAATSNQLIVDFSHQTGPVFHGTGFLYGLSEPNVPNANVLFVTPQPSRLCWIASI